MENVRDAVRFVNDQAAFHEATAEKITKANGPHNDRRAALHRSTAEKFRSLATFIVSLEAKVTNLAQEKQSQSPSWQQLSLKLDDIDGLPQELIEQLSLSDGDKTDFAIVALIDESGGISTIDRILIGLWKKTGEVHKRNNLTSRLYRLTQKGQLFSIGAKKGVYSTRELNAAESETLAS